MAKWTAIRYSSDHVFDYIEIDSQYAIFEVEIPENWIGKNVGQLDIRKNTVLIFWQQENMENRCCGVSGDSSGWRCYHIGSW